MPKNIVFCADGTWHHPGETDENLPADTNVYKFFKALSQTAGQAPHYDDGGTPIDRLLGGAIREGLFKKIKDGYTAIARSYMQIETASICSASVAAHTRRAVLPG